MKEVFQLVYVLLKVHDSFSYGLRFIESIEMPVYEANKMKEFTMYDTFS